MRLILARHAETVFNADRRMQGNRAHAPLTRVGIAQAEAMGAALARFLSGKDFEIWASPAGRTLQTAAIIAEHVARDFFTIRTDERLYEIDIGTWAGQRYDDIVARQGPILCPDRKAFVVAPPGGEWYPAVARRLREWLNDLDPASTVLVISHGLTLRVLRGLLVGGAAIDDVPLSNDVPQGSIIQIVDGRESLFHVGCGDDQVAL